MATLLTGATGFVGQQLIRRFEHPIVVSRNAAKAAERLGLREDQLIEWDPKSGPIQLAPDLKLDEVINLMGEPIAEGRWTEAKKKRIEESRVAGTNNLLKGLQSLDRPPACLVSASAVGIYGSQGDKVLDENASPGNGYLVDVCRKWEEAAMTFQSDSTRVVLVRIGIVLGRGGGALEKMIPLFRWGLGGTLGNGKHYVPWIHIHDLVNLIHWATTQPNLTGPLNGSAPNPVTNRAMTKALAKAVKRPALLPAPKFALRLALGEFAESLFFSQRVVPKLAIENGFEFRFPEIESAIKDALED